MNEFTYTNLPEQLQTVGRAYCEFADFLDRNVAPSQKRALMLRQLRASMETFIRSDPRSLADQDTVINFLEAPKVESANGDIYESVV